MKFETPKKIKKLLEKGKFTEAADEYNILATKARENDEFDLAIYLAEKGSKLSLENEMYLEASFCERSLAEIHALLGNEDKSMEHARNFMKFSEKCKNPSQQQLSHHVYAWCIEKLFDAGKVGRLELEKALEHIEESQNLIRKYEPTLKKSQKHGTIEARKVLLLNMAAQIHQLLGNINKAIQFINEAESIAKPLQYEEYLKYEVALTKLCLIDPKERLKLAKKLVEYANQNTKANAYMELSNQYFLSNHLSESYSNLQKVYFDQKNHRKNLSEIDIENVKTRLSILYKLTRYERHQRSKNTSEIKSLCEFFEAIADLYYKYFDTLTDKEKQDCSSFAIDNIVNNYLAMIENKRSIDDELRGLLGIALIFIDINEFSKARKYLEKRLIILEENDRDKNDIDDVKVSILNCHCKLGTIGVTDMFKDLEKSVRFPNNRKELFQIWSDHCGSIGQTTLEKVYQNKSDEIEEISVKNEDDESDFLFGDKSNEQILDICEEEYKNIIEIERIIANKEKTNAHGETLLHEAAKLSDWKKVELMCKHGYNVNAEDFGGWTPLSEAVDHCELKNIQILLKYGANVNCVSKENVEDLVSNPRNTRKSHSRITPLMDACCNGYYDIAKVLMENDADLRMVDSLGWTAYNHLVNFIEEKGCDDDGSDFKEYLKNEMQRQNISLIPAKVDRSYRRSLSPGKFFQLSDDIFESENYNDDNDDDCIIMPTTSQRTQKRPYSSDNIENLPKRKPMNYSKPPSLPSRPPPPFRQSPNCYQNNRMNRESTSKSPIQISPQFRQRVRELSPMDCSNPNQKQNDVSPDVVHIPSKSNKSDELIIVVLDFEGPEQFSKMKLSFRKNDNIETIKKKILENENKKKYPKISIFEKGENDERIFVNDDFKLEMFKKEEVMLICKLNRFSPLEKYKNETQESDIINEICERLEVLDTKKHLDLSHLFLDSKKFKDVLNILNNSEIYEDISLDLSRCDFNLEETCNLKVILKNCVSIICHNTKANFEVLFNDSMTKLRKFTISSTELRDQNHLANLFTKNRNLEEVVIIGIKTRNLSPSPIFNKIIELEYLKILNLSGNKWINDSDWRILLLELKNLEELKINDIETSIEFENEMLPKLSLFEARRSKLNWDSLIEFFSTSAISRIDIRGNHLTNLDDWNLLQQNGIKILK